MIYNIKPVAVVSNSREMIEDDNWGGVISTIELTKDMHESSLKGIDDFSHLEIIFYFDKVADEKIQYEARHPRNNTDYPEVGIFAQRGKNRPNKIGVTVVELLELKDRTLIVKGLDAIDGTPIIDIKPVMKEFLPNGEIKQPHWATDLMRNYWD
ncbi:tRNA (N6-threonylcarbamoyladenosine(37)-N6)-methyltransferase TrmO [Lysinibacillus xylanilyticus]|uniref:tRNA (N6-threonylcarbamoyladenosine(37)-N6)-methyltransferase TrmO n=1 Tax=Lysinibacillus xylanilyticus TaxID=582475 RepID=A0ABT4EPB6_9BACI|nr:tRNA (N6-threonylcarbamoyladenosine(37)-N6)-methyltransferase TrmO [Lysinibacillus xylanilyticus]MCY9547466.1 tRNA (N6-threonylcarbamoyladenosine(37)-N6)-methyltransferase TrmO [Lysinibacillus xylanilyticus]